MKETIKWSGDVRYRQRKADGCATLENCPHGFDKGHSGLNTISSSNSGNEMGILDGFENCIRR